MTTEPYSYLGYDPDFELPPEIAEGLEGVPEKNAMAVMAEYGGESFNYIAGYIGPIFFDPDYGTLPLRERKLMATVASAINGCPTCLIIHGNILGDLTSHGFARRLAANYHSVELSARERALADYAAKLTSHPNEVGPEDIQALRDVGLIEQDIYHVVETIAIFNWSNRFTSGLGFRPDDDFLHGLAPQGN